MLSGYEGMNERKSQIPVPEGIRMSEALEGLVKLYDATGKKAKADEWRKKLAEIEAPSKIPEKK